ncbi:GntR family transcriptional regulator [Actinomycetospora sp. NBRC 106375]|uniref:FadR/GntR family transcriptional regulator n=1 Tax=Actinomycetospora sp. NBRC 106375 TaxID=3032207 RepID=UPI0024A3042B|nr:FCD domain-containing protein [Actinomycetospora sp. NBRC 106375]GLZ48278.1 GntR family transcriptional regulator [Actinomycetospora sp. NBRC 106375]
MTPATERAADSVVDRVIGAVVARVESGEFSAGERLPPEADLAAQLDVSRLSLREAVRALVGAGVLEVRRGSGTFVTDLRPDRLVRASGTFLDLVGEQGVAELFECRRVLEPGVTALAATRVDETALRDLQDRLDRMRGLHEPERLVAEDLDFHAAIATAAGNATLAALTGAVAGRTARVRIWRAVVEHDVLSWTHDQHTAILRALRHRDSLAAWTAATTHVTEVEEWVRAHLDRRGGQ